MAPAPSRTSSRNWQNNENRAVSSYSGGGNLAPVSYFGPLSHFFSDMDRMFFTTFRNFGFPSMPGMQGLGMQIFRPNVDIASNENEYTITVEVPGMEEKDLRLNVSRDMLTISGEKRQEKSGNDKDMQCSECSYGAFTRSFPLPEDADAESVEAQFRNGVLTITCPRSGEAQHESRRIPINAGSGRESRESRETGQRDHSSDRPANNQGSRKAA